VLAVLLHHDGYTVDTAENGPMALAQLQVYRYDVLLCDLRMPDLNGPDLYALVLRQYAYLSQRVIFLTGDTLRAESRVHTPSEAYPPVGGAGEIQGDALATWWRKNALCSSYPHVRRVVKRPAMHILRCYNSTAERIISCSWKCGKTRQPSKTMAKPRTQHNGVKSYSRFASAHTTSVC
jgi:CheY-like chemotaxis protein